MQMAACVVYVNAKQNNHFYAKFAFVLVFVRMLISACALSLMYSGFFIRAFEKKVGYIVIGHVRSSEAACL